MKNLKSILLFSFGLVMCINQGFNVIIGTLNNGEPRGVDMLMPVDIPMLLLLLTQRDGSHQSSHRRLVLTMKIMLVLFWMWSMCGEFAAFEPAEFREAMFQLSRGLLIGYVVMTRISTFADLYIFILGLLSSLAFESFVGAWQWQIGPLHIPFLASSGGFRVSGTLGVSNTFGAWLVTLVPLCMRMALYCKLKPRVFWNGVMVVSLLVLLATYTRGAWFSFLSTTAVFTIIDVLRKKITFKQVSIFIGLAVVLAVFITIKYSTGIQERMSDANESLAGDQKSSRLYLAKDALRVIDDHRMIGVGLDNYRYYSDKEIGGTRIVHNVFLLITAEQGIPAAIIFILFFVISITTGWKLLKSNNTFYYHTGAATLCGILNLFIYYQIGLDYRIFEVLFQHWRIICMIPAILICEEHSRRIALARLAQRRMQTAKTASTSVASKPEDSRKSPGLNNHSRPNYGSTI
jgi:hypothetical protein